MTPEQRAANVERVRANVERQGRPWKITDEAVLAPIVDAIESALGKDAPDSSTTRRHRRGAA
jgi:hypothetical protein